MAIVSPVDALRELVEALDQWDQADALTTNDCLSDEAVALFVAASDRVRRAREAAREVVGR